MGGPTRIGYGGAVLKEMMPSPIIKQSTREVKEIFQCDYDKVDAAIANRGISFNDPCPITGYSTSLLGEITISKTGPSICRVVYEYAIFGLASESPPVGTVVRESDSNTIEIPIGQNPRASGTNYSFTKKIGKGVWEGVEAYISPQPVYTRTEILSSFTFTEAAIVDNVTRRMTTAQMAAKGLASATNNAWLKVELAVKVSGSKFEKTERFQYAGDGWDTDIYEVAT